MKWIPRDPWRRKWLGMNALPMHILRVFSPGVPPTQVPLFPGEDDAIDGKKRNKRGEVVECKPITHDISDDVKSFLAFRKSHIQFFASLGVLVVVMSVVQSVGSLSNHTVRMCHVVT